MYYIVYFQSFDSFLLVAIKGAEHMDELSWRMMLILLEGRKMFIVMTMEHEDNLTRKLNRLLYSRTLPF